eukprot:4124290-Pleurochrysis_carterae.AAC.2
MTQICDSIRLASRLDYGVVSRLRCSLKACLQCPSSASNQEKALSILPTLPVRTQGVGRERDLCVRFADMCKACAASSDMLSCSLQSPLPPAIHGMLVVRITAHLVLRGIHVIVALKCLAHGSAHAHSFA